MYGPSAKKVIGEEDVKGKGREVGPRKVYCFGHLRSHGAETVSEDLDIPGSLPNKLPGSFP